MAFPFDDKLRDYLRMNNTFGGDMGPRQMNPNQPIGANPNMLSPEEEEYYNMGDFDYTKAFNEQYHPESGAGNRLDDMMNRMPQRNNPNIWRKLAAVGVSAGAPENVERTLYSPYHREMQDWQTGLAPALKAAELEKSNNANLRAVAASVASGERSEHNLRRQIAANRATNAQATRRNAETERANRTREGFRERELDLDADKFELDKLVKEEGGQIKVDDFGYASILTHTGKQLPVKGRYLSEESKAQLYARYPRFAPQLTPQKSVDPKTGRTVWTILDEGTGKVRRAVWEDEQIPQPPPGAPRPNPNPNQPNARPETGGTGGTGGSVEPAPETESTATEQLGVSREVQNKADRAAARFPTLSKYLRFNKSGQFLGIKPTTDWTGPSNDDHATLYKAIYGSGGAPTDQPGTGIRPPTNRPQQAAPARAVSPARPGYIKIRNKTTGQSGDLLKGSPMPAGFEEVK